MKTLKVKFNKRTLEKDYYLVDEDDLIKQAKEKLNFDVYGVLSSRFINGQNDGRVQEINILRDENYRKSHNAIKVRNIPIIT